MAQQQDPRDKKIAAKVANGIEGQEPLPVDETPPIETYVEEPTLGVEEAFARGRQVGHDEGVTQASAILARCAGSTCDRVFEDNDTVIIKEGRLFCRTFCMVYGA